MPATPDLIDRNAKTRVSPRAAALILCAVGALSLVTAGCDDIPPPRDSTATADRLPADWHPEHRNGVPHGHSAVAAGIEADAAMAPVVAPAIDPEDKADAGSLTDNSDHFTETLTQPQALDTSSTLENGLVVDRWKIAIPPMPPRIALPTPNDTLPIPAHREFGASTLPDGTMSPEDRRALLAEKRHHDAVPAPPTPAPIELPVIGASPSPAAP